MSGKTVLVTGASRGIGRAIARRMAAEGHHVVGLSRRAPETFEGDYFEADLTDRAATREALAEIASRHQVLRLVNNAGVAGADRLGEIAPESFERQIAVNLRAAVDGIEACLPAMRAAKFGRIVNIGSRAALGRQERIVYSMTKAGIDGLTRSAALELAPEGITVNCVAPGPIDTEMYAEGNPPGSPSRQAVLGQCPVGRIGTPEEIAAAAGYFLSDEAGYTTGQTLYVCGGLSVAITKA